MKIQKVGCYEERSSYEQSIGGNSLCIIYKNITGIIFRQDV